MRGLAIIGVLISHNLILDVWYGRQAFQIIPPWIIGLLFPLLLIFTWAGSFVLVSGIAIAYSSYHRFTRGLSRRRVLVPVIVSSTLLLLLDPVRTLIFSRSHLFMGEMTHSLFSSGIMTGQWVFPNAERLFMIGALPMIGLSGYVAAFMVWVLFSNNGANNFKRNMRILVIAGAIFSVVSVPYSYALGPVIEKMLASDHPPIFAAYLLRLLGSAQLSFFPLGTYVFFGVAYGMLLAARPDIDVINKYLNRFGIGFFIATAVSIPLTFLLTKNPIRVLGNFDIYSPSVIYFSLGCITYIFKALVKHVEYGTSLKRQRFAKKTLWIRRFGVITLTLYIIDAVPGMFVSEYFHKVFGGKALWTASTGQDAFMTNAPAIILFVGLMFLFWYLVAWFWEKYNFTGSFEWFMVRFSKLFRKEKSSRLNLKNNLYVDMEDESGKTRDSKKN
ncbi:MAG: hypothetical protein KAT14_01435 [Candidatus Marinimicrobia bacterium]|nr:hypothetical protein [Candidatus Neomarinimicrobiota bacterium]